jgi:hypothetical protein
MERENEEMKQHGYRRCTLTTCHSNPDDLLRCKGGGTVVVGGAEGQLGRQWRLDHQMRSKRQISRGISFFFVTVTSTELFKRGQQKAEEERTADKTPG